ncbi:MAG: chromate transporter [Oscillospiraceae bacterium]|nr:chromate transporter [Oscillospiraceae bacterium]
MTKDNWGRTLSVFKTFLKFGCFTFGGGWSIVAQMQKEYVEKKGWISNEELLDFTSVARSTPGLMIGNTSVLFGYHAAGVPGALAALLGMVIPPIIVMLGVVYLYDLVKDNLYVARAMVGVRASVVPVIFSALLKLFRSGMKDAFCYLIAAAAFCLCLFTDMSNVLIVLMGAAAGLFYREAKLRHDLS